MAGLKDAIDLTRLSVFLDSLKNKVAKKNHDHAELTIKDALGGTKTYNGTQSVTVEALAGEPGYSPTITVEDIDGGHQLKIVDKDGTKTVDVMDGESVAETITANTFGRRNDSGSNVNRLIESLVFTNADGVKKTFPVGAYYSDLIYDQNNKCSVQKISFYGKANNDDAVNGTGSVTSDNTVVIKNIGFDLVPLGSLGTELNIYIPNEYGGSTMSSNKMSLLTVAPQEVTKVVSETVKNNAPTAAKEYMGKALKTVLNKKTPISEYEPVPCWYSYPSATSLPDHSLVVNIDWHIETSEEISSLYYGTYECVNDAIVVPSVSEGFPENVQGVVRMTFKTRGNGDVRLSCSFRSRDKVDAGYPLVMLIAVDGDPGEGTVVIDRITVYDPEASAS